MSATGTRQLTRWQYTAIRAEKSLLAVCVFFCLASNLFSEEPARKFLDALASRGYHDSALDYLDWLERSGMVPKDLRETIDFEQGNILLKAARSQQDTTVREQDLGKARKRFEAFLAKNAKHPRAADAQSGLRQIKVELARGLMQQATKPGADQKTLRKKAQGYFDEVAKSFEARTKDIRLELEEIKKGSSKADNRDQLRAEYLQSKLMSATIAYEAAATAKSNKKNFEKRLKAADKQFEDLTKKYRTWLAGILSVYYRGQIQQDMGNLKEALVFYEEHIGEMDQPDAFRNVAVKATANAIQCWTDPELKQYDKAIEVGEQWITAAQSADNNKPEWLTLRMRVAQAYRAKAESTDGAKADGLRTQARKTAQFVARFPGPTQSVARKFVADLGGPVAEAIDGNARTFKSARTAAMQVRQELNNVETVLKLQKSKEARDRDDAEIAALQKQRDEQVATTLKLHQRAIQLGDVKTDGEQLTDLQFYQCYLLYTSGRYFEAAVLGDYIATNFPSSGGARTAANIALVSYATVRNESRNSGVQSAVGGIDFVGSQLETLANHIVQTWPGQKETDEALITLVSYMARDGRFDQATEYLNKIPADSPRRGEAEIRTGQSLWASYIRGVAEDPANADEELKTRAQVLLKSGIDRMKQAAPTPTLVRAVLSLSQVYLDINEPQPAVELLEDKQFGPKTLADKKSELVMSTPGLAEQVYRAALRGYIGTSSLKKLNATMDALGKTVDDTPKGKQRLVGIYMALAKDLQKQIQLAPAKERKSLSASFDKFLSEVSSSTKEFSILNWVAFTYSNLGDGLNSDPQKVSADAKRFYDKSATAYDQILKLNDKGTVKLEKNLVNTVRMRLASTQSRLGKYDEAVATFTDILSESNSMLNVQVEAARALQAGAAAGRTEWYRRAVMGDPRTGGKKVAIWGWGKISKIVAMQMYKGEEQKKKYSATFYDARLQMAQCQFGQAGSATGEKKAKYLANAKKVITSTAGLYPNLGGPKWKKKYNQLYAQIQTALGEPVKGF